MKKKIFALSLAAAILSMTAACTTARNDGANTGTMAGSSMYGEADNLNTSYNGAILDDTHTVVGGVVEDAAKGVSDAAEDLTDRPLEDNPSGTDAIR